MSPKRLAVLLAPLLAFVLASPASAANRYIDDSGSNAGGNTCLNKNNPCRTINYAGSIGDSTDTYLVGGGTYDEEVTLCCSASLVGSNFDPPGTAGAAIVDGAGGNGTGITTNTSGEISGLTVRGFAHGIVVNGGSPTITNDVFDDPQFNNFGRVEIDNPASATITGDTFVGAPALNDDTGVWASTTGALTVADSTFKHLGRGIFTQSNNSSITVRDNVITVRGTGSGPGDYGSGIFVQGGSGASSTQILRNRVAGEPPGQTYGIESTRPGGAFYANRVSDLTKWGVVVLASGHLVTMDSDVLVRNGEEGVVALGTATGLKLTNETITANGGAHQVKTPGSVSIDSSIIGARGVSAAKGCTITFSRGPTTAGNSCQRFETSANPRFVSPTDSHLLPSSPLIDAGNPLAPPAGATDADGNPRALDGNRDCVVRRDMGAFEFVAKPCVRPKCRLKPKSSRVSVASGVIRLRARCDQKVAVKLSGKVKIKQPGGKTKSLALDPVTAHLKRKMAKTVKLELPKAALQALTSGAKESARFKLSAKNSNGATGTATAKIKRLVPR